MEERGITVNAADPGIVSTDIITMHQWFDPLTDIFFRPFIRTPMQGASTAVGLLLDKRLAGKTGTFNLNNHSKPLSDKYINHVQKRLLWDETEKQVKKWRMCPVRWIIAAGRTERGQVRKVRAS